MEINTKDDYKAALAEIDAFGDPAQGTPEFQCLDHLVDQVEAYEATNHPIGPVSAEDVAEYEAEKQGIVLTPRDYALFEEIMVADGEPTELALRGAAEFMSGTIGGSRYR